MSSIRANKGQTTTASSKEKKSQQTAQLQSQHSQHQNLQDSENAIATSPRMNAVQLKTQQIEQGTVQRRENNTGLPDQLKAGIEQLSGLDMSDTRVHYNSAKPAQLQAHAYAQGTDIHLAPGQEKHLAHEAWHVVQQKQGRVKATTQLKGKTPINDDAGLEREADIMGAKALHITASTQTTVQQKSIANTNQPVQRYSVVQDSHGKVFNKSANGHFLVGIGYPNHDLYVQNEDMITQLNDRLDASLIKFVNKGTHQITINNETKDYVKVYPGHKTAGPNRIDEASLGTGIKDTLINNLAKKQYKDNLNDDQEYKDSEFNDQFDLINKRAEFTNDPGSSMNIYSFKLMAEFVRKSLSQMGYTHDETDVIQDTKKAYIKTYAVINSYLKGTGKTKKDVNTSLVSFKNEIPILSVDPMIEKIMYKTGEMLDFLPKIPDTSTDFLVKKGHLNHQFSQMDQGELLLPRGCDIVAGTTMGKATDENTPTPFSMRFIMNSSQGDDHKHFSTKIFGDDTDFVTIEGFAASGLNIFDDTWEFFLHGNRETEVDSFNDYTMARYDFFDIKKPYMDTYNNLTEERRNDRSGGDYMQLGVFKKMDADPAQKAVDFYNEHIATGGGQKTLKTKARRDLEELNRLKPLLYNEANRIIEAIPASYRTVTETPYTEVKNRMNTELMGVLNSGRNATIHSFQLALTTLVKAKMGYHEFRLLELADSKNYLKYSIQDSSLSFNAKADDVITGCNNRISKNKLSYGPAILIKNEVNQLKRKFQD